jgi:hypothetical protein
MSLGPIVETLEILHVSSLAGARWYPAFPASGSSKGKLDLVLVGLTDPRTLRAAEKAACARTELFAFETPEVK